MVIRTQNLGKKFGQLWAVKDLNLEIEKGQVYGFLGPNGAGKSTTIRMLLNLVHPTRGRIEIFGKKVKSSGAKIYRRVGALVEKPDFYLYLSAWTNLKMLGDLSGGVNKKRIDEVLEIVKLSDRAREKVRNFSHGMRQRLGIAQALLHEPELLILDEPTDGLDPVGIKEIRELIIQLNRDFGKTIFLSSHLLYEVEQTCTHIGIINKGELIVQGEIQTLMRESEIFVTELEVDDINRAMEICHHHPKVQKCDVKNGLLNVWIMSCDRWELVSDLVGGGVRVYSVIPRASLESLYVSLVRDSDL